MVKIEEHALFVADAHFPTHASSLLPLLYRIEAGETTVSQLFLMGDIFDLLIGGIEETYTANTEVITLIQSIADKLPVFYFEGNHDFQLKKLFSNITLYSREEQPQYMNYRGFTVGLSHGDRFAVGWRHHLFSKVLRRDWVLKGMYLLRPAIVRQVQRRLNTKEICRRLPHFDKKAKKIFEAYHGAYWVIEGHYHQATEHYGYYALPSLACQNQVAILRKKQIFFVDTEDI